MRPAFSRICVRIRSVFGSVFTSKSTIRSHLTVAGGVQRIHVVHVVHAAHLLLDGRGHGLLEGLRIGADVGGLDLNFRRRDVGKLRDRQTQDGDRADDHHEDRDHHRDDGTVDEEF